MKMRAGGPAGLSDVANGVALLDALSLAQAAAEFRQVRVERGVLVVVLENDGIPIAALGAYEVDAGVGCCPNGGSGWGGVIDPAVCSPCFQNGMKTPAESRADSGKLKR